MPCGYFTTKNPTETLTNSRRFCYKRLSEEVANMPREFTSISLGEKPDPRWAETFCIVEATDFEMNLLRNKWRDEIRLCWEEFHNGTSIIKVGELHGLPMAITVTWIRIEGKLVAFWGCSSQVAHYDMIDAWLIKTLRAGVGRYTPENFRACVEAILTKNGKILITACSAKDGGILISNDN
jgi:hypothetical protein